MSELQPLARALIIGGLILLGLGLLLLGMPKFGWFGRLPGDILIRRDGFTFYMPLTSGLLLSVVVSLIVWLVGRFR